MKLDPTGIEISADAAEARQQLRARPQQALVAPEDDAWATFAAWPNPTRRQITAAMTSTVDPTFLSRCLDQYLPIEHDPKESHCSAIRSGAGPSRLSSST
jgi:hypothetical protein